MGQDIKVMSVRREDQIRLTIAAAMVDRFIPDKDHYSSCKEQLRDRVLDHAKKYTGREVAADINTGDNYMGGVLYLTVTGLSWENGDDGSVGRGNRANGLITPYRPMSLEATAGKNPVTHVGKLYNVLAKELAREVHEAGKGDIDEVHIRIVSQIGKPIDFPQAATAQLIMAKGVKVDKVKREAEAIIEEGLANLPKLTMRFVKGEVSVF